MLRQVRPLRVFAGVFLASVGAVGAACVSSSGTPISPGVDAGGFDANTPGVDSSPTPADTGADTTAPHDAGTDSSDASVNDSSVTDAADAAGPDASDGAPPAPTPLATGQTNPEGVTVANGHLFWVDYTAGTLSTCAAASCTPSVLLTGLSNPVAITNDGTNLYWAANNNPGNLLSASITQCLIGAEACSTSVQTLGSNLAYPGDVSFDGANLYFTVLNELEGGTSDTVSSCPKTGCPTDGGLPTVVATGISQDPGDTFVQGTSLYYGDYVTGIFVCTLPACATATKVPPTGYGINGVALDSTNFYWCDQNAGVIYSCPIGGCGDAMAPTVVGRGFGYPNQIALDTSYVYVSDGAQAAEDAGVTRGIYRLPK